MNTWKKNDFGIHRDVTNVNTTHGTTQIKPGATELVTCGNKPATDLAIDFA